MSSTKMRVFIYTSNEGHKKRTLRINLSSFFLKLMDLKHYGMMKEKVDRSLFVCYDY